MSKDAVAALWAPTGGIVCPFNLTIALAENANTNGVEFRFNTQVTGLSKNKSGWAVQTNGGILDTRYVVNAAGLYSDVIHNMEGGTVIEITGNTCSRGAEYAKKEVTNPTRIVTSSVRVCGSKTGAVTVSCKTRTDVPKGKMFEVVKGLKNMILPPIVNVSETALRAVPKEYEEASLALGATKMETWFRVSLQAAKSGIAAAVVMGIGRAIGEAMAIIMVSGNVANMPSLTKSVRFLTTAIASEMSYASYGSLQRQALFSIGLVLFLFIMLLNAFLNLIIKRGGKEP